MDIDTSTLAAFTKPDPPGTELLGVVCPFTYPAVMNFHQLIELMKKKGSHCQK